MDTGILQRMQCFVVLYAKEFVLKIMLHIAIAAREWTERSQTMKFRNPETGEVFADLMQYVFEHICNPRTGEHRCVGCPIDFLRSTLSCGNIVLSNPNLVSDTIGYEIIREPGVDFPEPEYDPDEVALKGAGIDPVKPLEIEEVKYLESEAMKEDTPMSTKIRPAVEKLAEMEKQDANRKFPLFHSLHEGYAVLLEEVEEAREALTRTEISLSALWAHIRDNNAGRAPEFAGRVREHALDLAVEAVQAAAMAQKLIDSMKKEDHHEQSD